MNLTVKSIYNESVNDKYRDDPIENESSSAKIPKIEATDSDSMDVYDEGQLYAQSADIFKNNLAEVPNVSGITDFHPYLL